MIHLHIGRHKTGTSALQRFLLANRRRLSRAGIDYPKSLSGRAAHHDLALAFHPRRLAQADAETRARAVTELERIAAWAGAGHDTLLSSEAFQNIDPAAAAAVFPRGGVTVIAYLREPLDYLLSSYAQAIQAQPLHRPFLDYAAGFRPDYATFLDGWAAAFGDQDVRARVYDRETLVGGDVRLDLLHVLGVEPAGFALAQESANPSIGPELIEFKGVLNAILSPAEQESFKLYNHLSRIAADFPARLTVPRAFQDAVRARSDAPCREAFARYLDRPGETFRQKDFSGHPAPVDIDAVAERALDLIAQKAPTVARRLRARLPARISELGVEPLLPAEWSAL